MNHLKLKFNVLMVKTNDFFQLFDDIVLLIKNSIESLGHECTITVNEFQSDRINILIGSVIFAARYHNLNEALKGEKFILYQLEQLHDNFGLLKEWPAYYSLLEKATFIWDYSQSNVEYLSSKGFDNVCYLPPGYHPSLEVIKNNNLKDIDVLFIGSPHKRRSDVVNLLLSKKINVLHLHKSFGAERNSFIARSKIVLNLHAWDSLNILETVRISFLLSNEVFVISEFGDHNPYDDGLVYSEYADISDTCQRYLLMGKEVMSQVAARGKAIIKNIKTTSAISDFLCKFEIEQIFFKDLNQPENRRYHFGKSKDSRALHDNMLKQDLYAEFIRPLKVKWGLNRLNPEPPFMIGNIYIKHKKFINAIAFFKRVLELDPTHVWALNNLGVAHNELGHQKEAIECYDSAIEHQPDFADFYANRAKAFLNSSRYEEAIRDCYHGIRLNPSLPTTFYNLGLACIQVQHHSDALDAFSKALALNPQYFEVICARAQLYQSLKQPGQALEDWSSALNLRPDDLTALNGRAVLLKDARLWQRALSDLNHALKVNPSWVPTLNNRGVVLHELGLWDAALADFEKILTISETYHQAWNNKANVWLDLGQHDKAIACYQKALAIKHDYGWAHLNLGLCLLQLGNMAQGWRHYEWRWLRDDNAKNPRQFSEPLWLGDEAIQGKTLFVYAEQGLGDTLQFARLVHQVVHVGAQVVLEVQAPLMPLFKDWCGGVAVIARGEPLPKFDFQCPLLSLPLALRLSLETLPKLENYLVADPEKVKKWRRILGPSEKPLIGLVWSGNPGLKNDLQRSIGAELLLDALPKGCRYVALHKEYREHDKAVFQRHPELMDFSTELVDFSETAALCSCMSFIVSVDTSVAHLSAAMGIPVWLMLPFNSDFRWLLHRTDSPWYPSMRLFRQSRPREWGEVLRSVGLAIEEALIDSKRVQAKFLEAMSAHQAGHFDGVEDVYRKTIEALPNHADAWHLLGVLLVQMEKNAQGIECIQQALSIHPKLAPARFNLGLQLTRLGDIVGAVDAFQQTLSLNPNHIEARFQLGIGLQKLGKSEQAINVYSQLLGLMPKHYQSLCNRAVLWHELGRYDQALEDYAAALSIDPNCVDALSNQSVTLNALGKYSDARHSCLKANGLLPNNPVVLHNLGFSLQGLKKSNEAIAAYRSALTIRPDYAECWNNLGNSQSTEGHLQESIQSHTEAIRCRPDFADAYFNRANVWFQLKRFEKAIQDYEQAQRLNPDLAFADGTLMHARMQACHWENFEAFSDALFAAIRSGKKAITPFALLGMTDDLTLLKQSCETYASYKTIKDSVSWVSGPGQLSTKIHLAYFSADFHNHATAYLMAELFESHDRGTFHVSAYSFGPPSFDSMRQRLVHAFDEFHDVRGLSSHEIVRHARENRLDIAIDLKGFTKDNRSDIFAMRVAPVQINYLGFPGTSGMKTMDYLVADPITIPLASRDAYSEKIAYLPDCYQVNDRSRTISDRKFRRQEFNLPERHFVFCCFNNNYKILPSIFSSWMRILKMVPQSVLWLLSDNTVSVENLKQEATHRGVSPDRLVFSERMPLPEHLARHRLADLFLDTSPYNAHTTCSDALWAGLPVLTFPGESFASRVSASLLLALGLPELVQPDLENYESMAIFLALNPERLDGLRQKLEKNKSSQPLFDTPRFTLNFETLLKKMNQRRLSGLSPDHLWVS